MRAYPGGAGAARAAGAAVAVRADAAAAQLSRCLGGPGGCARRAPVRAASVAGPMGGGHRGPGGGCDGSARTAIDHAPPARPDDRTRYEPAARLLGPRRPGATA